MQQQGWKVSPSANKQITALASRKAKGKLSKLQDCYETAQNVLSAKIIWTRAISIKDKARAS